MVPKVFDPLKFYCKCITKVCKFKFKKLRNTVTSKIRQSKEHCRNVIVNKLKLESLTSRDWWSTLKNIISGGRKASIPPLENDGTIFSDDLDKANILNNYFRDRHMWPQSIVLALL